MKGFLGGALFRAIAVVFLGLQAGAALAIQSSACSQYGGAVTCVPPLDTPDDSKWLYDPLSWSVPTQPTAEAYLEYVFAIYRQDIQARPWAYSYCDIEYRDLTCGEPYYIQVYLQPPKMQRSCAYTQWIRPKEWNGKCLDQWQYQWPDRSVTGQTDVIAKCPAGYSQTVGGAFIPQTGRSYPFLCAETPPPDPTPDEGPDAGGPGGEDTTPASPDTTPPAPPPGAPDAPQPGEGGSGGSGSGDSCNGIVGDPINTANGSKFVTIADYVPVGASPLRLIRYYDSKMPMVAGALGANWRHYYERQVEAVSASVVKLRRADGKVFKFTLANGQWSAEGGVNLRVQLLGAGQGWRVSGPRDELELYDAQGRLIQITARGGMSQSLAYAGSGKLTTVTDSFGLQLKFEYDSQGRVALVTDPAGKLYRYTYDAAGNLGSRITPDNRALTYLYQNPGFPHALTGVVDGNGVQIDTTFYDAKGRAYGNERNAGIDKVTIDYADGGTASVTDAYSTNQSYTFQLIQGVMKTTGMARSCPTCGAAARSFTRDANGNVTSRTDFNGIRTTYQYDLARNLETVRTEAVGTAVERTVLTEWHPTLHVPVKVTSPGRVTDMVYDDNGNMTMLTVTDTATNERRQWQYRYGDYGLLVGRTLPGGESVTYTYDDKGLLTSAITVGGLETQYRDYDANGHVGTIIYPGGRTVAYTYDEVGRVLTRAEAVQQGGDGASWWQQVIEWLRKLLGLSSAAPEAQGESGTAVTRYTYDGAGLLSDISLPDGESLHYEYDAAYRLVLARDVLGNTIQISRDPMGKPLSTTVMDGSGSLAMTLRQTYDELGRVATVWGNNGQQLRYRYDEEGYLLEQVTALGQRTARGRDALYRTTSLTDADNQSTQFEFDPMGQLMTVTDARGNRTRYGRNAFGETVSEQSPDRGNLLRAFENGRLQQVTDARGLTRAFTYDADGRVLTRTSPNSSVTYHYDDGMFGKGRLTGIDDASGSTRYRYNSQGRVAEKTSVIVQGPTLKVSYGYTLGGKLKEVATPGKHLVQYGYDDQGRLSGVSVDGQALLSQVRFGAQGITGWTWASGGQRDERYDQDGRITQITSGSALARTYGYDTANRLTSLLDTQAGVKDRYGYDAVGRLLSQQSSTLSVSYRYDALGNRTQKQLSGQAANATTHYTYDPASNRLLGETTNGKAKSYTYLPSGQLNRDGDATYSYNDDGRLVDVGGQRPLHSDYNALGQRVRKAGQGVLVFVYDETGHLLGEYTPGGVMVREYIWLGNHLVGMLSQQEKHVLYVHTDHLGTPRAVSDGATVLWRWEGDAFGADKPNEQVAGPSRRFTLPLRFPGQYFDQETGLFYNYFRDYDPATGRFVESDPLGLAGGINLFAYVGGTPTHASDPLGLQTVIVVNNNHWAEVWSMVAGTHVGMYTSNGGDPIMYDPGGSYGSGHGAGSGDFIEAGPSTLTDYIMYQIQDGSNVDVYSFDTTPEQEKQIVENIMNGGNYGPGQCAAGVSNAINGIGPFKDLGTYSTPKGLGNALDALQGGK